MSQADRDVSEKGEKTAQAAAESTSASFVPSVPLSVQVKAGCHELMDAKKKKKKDPGTQTFVCMCVCACVQVVMAAVFITPFTNRSPGANQIGFRRADRKGVGERGGGHTGTVEG